MIKLFKPKRRYNKIIIAGLVLIASVVVSGWALGYGQNNNRDGLVIDIDFSEGNYNSGTRTFTDQSGNGNHAVSTNPATFAPDKDGKSTGAMRFITTNDEVVIPHSSSYKTPSLTVSYWYRPEDIGKRHVIFTSWTGFTTELSGTTFKWGLNGLSGQYYGSSSINWDEWVHLTGTFDNTTKQQCIYFNGVKKECQTVSGSISYGTGALYLSGPWEWIKGDFGSVKVYNRALSEAEVRGLYSASKPKLTISSLEKGLIGHWPLNEQNYNSTTGRATDVSAYSRHGINGGSDLVADRLGKANAAMQFDGGSNDLIDIVDTPKLPKFSLSAWVYNESGGDSRHSLMRDYWEIVGTQICYFSYDFINEYWRCSANDALPVNTWTQVVTTWDGSVIRHYTNGNLIWTDPLTSSGTSQVFTAIGGYASRKLKARVSDVKIYDRALTSDEIKRAYDHNNPKLSSSSLSKGLVLDMPLTSAYVKGGAAGSEIVTDLTPFSRNGQNVNAVITSDGAVFNGVNSDIRFGTGNTFFPLPKFTISMWFKSTGTVPTTGITPGLFGFTYGLRATLGTNGDLQFGVDDGTSFRYLYTSGKNYKDGQWHHFVGMNDGSNSYLYIDGDFIAQAPYIWSGTTRWPTDTFRIGRDNNDNHYHFLGNLKNLRIYNRTLTATEVKSLFDQGRGTSGVMMNQ
ncbi:MAG: LamG-like jellyroll fold domain-containing protein [bacterium]|nr:LamG-like jellyroll fold domain-containing protein [bacterium]